MFRRLFLKNRITERLKKNPLSLFGGYVSIVGGISLCSMNNAINNATNNKTSNEYYESIVFIA
tara:strand:+ start:1970 stop:2158 length:189 start_codon:yes stop_codon:yes gene_type:complete